MTIFPLKRSALALFLTLIGNSFSAKKWTTRTNCSKRISPLHAHHESELAARKGGPSFLWSSGGSSERWKGRRKGQRRRGGKLNRARGGMPLDGRLEAQTGANGDKHGGEHSGEEAGEPIDPPLDGQTDPHLDDARPPRAFTIRDAGTLVGGHVTVTNGAFKQCRGVILDVKKTDKEEYELLVVINRDESAKYPKNILNRFGKSYWFNVKDVQVERVKDLLFHRYENFYDEKGRPAEGGLQEVKERFGELSGEEESAVEGKGENAVEGMKQNAVEGMEENEVEGMKQNAVEGKEENAVEEKEVGHLSSEDVSVANGEANAANGEAPLRPDLITLQESLLEGKRRPRKSAFCHTVVKQIEKNYMYEDLLNLYREKRHLANIVVCFYILKQLVKICSFEKESESGLSAFQKNVIHSTTFETILTDVLTFLEKKDIYRVVDKTWLLWILVKLNIHKEQTYRSTFEAILNHLLKYLTYETLKKMNTKSLCAILWSLAKCSHSNIQVCKTVYKKAIYFLEKYTQVMSCQDISNVYYSLGLVNYPNGDSFFNLIDQEINKKISKFSVQNLMNILYGMTKLKRNNSTFAVVKDKLLFHSSNMNLRNMSLFLWCLNRNEYYHVDVNFKGKSFHHLNVKQAMQLLMFFNYNRDKYVHYLKYVLSFLFKWISQLTNQEISFLFYSLSKLNLLKGSCFVKIRKHITQRDHTTFNVIDLNMILLSMNNSNLYDRVLFHYLFRALRGVLSRALRRGAEVEATAREEATTTEEVTTAANEATTTANEATTTANEATTTANEATTTANEATTTATEATGGMAPPSGRPPLDCTNLNYVMKNLSEMKIFDQSIMLKYALFFSSNLARISADQICDYLFYTLSLSNPGGSNQVGGKLQMVGSSKREPPTPTSHDQMVDSSKREPPTPTSHNQMVDSSKCKLPAPTSPDQRIAHLVTSNEELSLKEANFGKVYRHYLTRVTQFVKDKLPHFDAHSFLAHLEEQQNGKRAPNAVGEKQEKDKIDTFVFNYQTEKKHEHVQKLNELILEQTTSHAAKATLLGDLVSDKEFSSFVNEREDSHHHDGDNVAKKKKKKAFPCTSINSLIHLFYALASLNELDEDRVDHYMDNLYTVVERKKSEITAYQWLLIKDIFKMVRVKRSADWQLLLDNVNTYVRGAEQEGSARFETINVEI
ncbi:conserved Plasmodium protein, unknown function [Plasmodium vivax]|uniref:Heptatricopeptide repeat-containing protein n=2 Tax=Plasmodium vivax TaxID=5855 RepID=A0A1G4GVK8_PLAVI|nr:conserved Plasmodium protein, unknown function [Plasmodium vivax]